MVILPRAQRSGLGGDDAGRAVLVGPFASERGDRRALTHAASRRVFHPAAHGPAFPHQQTYIVQSGDTLGKIAEKFGVSMDDLATSTILTIRTCSRRDAADHSGGPQTEQAFSGNPTVTPQDGEAYPWPIIDSVLSAGVLGNEAVKIVNPGPTADLTGWGLRTPGGAEYEFKEFSLVAQGAVLIHTASGIDTSIDLYWDLKAPVWHSGDEVLLLDSLGNLRSVFVIP